MQQLVKTHIMQLMELVKLVLLMLKNVTLENYHYVMMDIILMEPHVALVE